MRAYMRYWLRAEGFGVGLNPAETDSAANVARKKALRMAFQSAHAVTEFKRPGEIAHVIAPDLGKSRNTIGNNPLESVVIFDNRAEIALYPPNVTHGV